MMDNTPSAGPRTGNGFRISDRSVGESEDTVDLSESERYKKILWLRHSAYERIINDADSPLLRRTDIFRHPFGDDFSEKRNRSERIVGTVRPDDRHDYPQNRPAGRRCGKTADRTASRPPADGKRNGFANKRRDFPNRANQSAGKYLYLSSDSASAESDDKLRPAAGKPPGTDASRNRY